MERLKSASQMICAGCKKVVAISKHDFCKACRSVSEKKSSARRKSDDDLELLGLKKPRKTSKERLVERLLRKIK